MNEFYVYAVVDDFGIPLYIGKGKGRRYLVHESGARNWANTRIARRIREIWNRGGVVRTHKIFITNSESEAYRAEVALIDLITSFGSVLENIQKGGYGGVDGVICHPSMRIHLRELAKKRWQNPVYRAKYTQARVTKEYRNIRKEISKAKWEDPAYRKKTVENSIAAMKSPAVRAMMTEQRREFWKNNRATQIAILGAHPIKCVETGEVFDSMCAAGKSVGQPGGNVYHSIHKGYVCGGVHFQFADGKGAI